MMAQRSPPKTKKPSRQWRDYRTPAGGRPVKDVIDALNDDEVAAIIAGMKEIVQAGLPAARHLRGDVYEGSSRCGNPKLPTAFRGRGEIQPSSALAFRIREEDSADAEARARRRGVSA